MITWPTLETEYLFCMNMISSNIFSYFWFSRIITGWSLWIKFCTEHEFQKLQCLYIPFSATSCIFFVNSVSNIFIYFQDSCRCTREMRTKCLLNNARKKENHPTNCDSALCWIFQLFKYIFIHWWEFITISIQNYSYRQNNLSHTSKQWPSICSNSSHEQ